MYTVNCNHQTGDWKLRMQCQEDTGFFFWKEELSSTVYSSYFSKHLLFLCSFNNLDCLISFNNELHESLIYTWIQSPFQICDLQIFFFYSIGFHFILLMAFFTMQNVLSLMWSHWFIFAVVAFAFDD